MKHFVKNLLIDIVLLIGLTSVAHPAPITPPYYNYIYTTATTCNTLTSGKATMMCIQQSDHTLWQCIPNSGFLGTCNTSGEWVAVSGSGGGGLSSFTSPNMTLNIGGTLSAPTADINWADPNVFTATQTAPLWAGASSFYMNNTWSLDYRNLQFEEVDLDQATLTSYPHGHTTSNGKFFIGQRNSVQAIEVYTNPSSLTSQSVATPSGWYDGESLTTNPNTGVVYAAFSNSTTQLEILSINPTTYATAQVCNTPLTVGASATITNDGTYIYLGTYTSQANIYKIQISNCSISGPYLWSGSYNAHASFYSSGTGNVYFTDSGSNFMKFNPTTHTITDIVVSGVSKFTKTFYCRNINSTTDYCYAGGENAPTSAMINTNGSMSYTIFPAINTFEVASDGTDLYIMGGGNNLNKNMVIYRGFNISNPIPEIYTFYDQNNDLYYTPNSIYFDGSGGLYSQDWLGKSFYQFTVGNGSLSNGAFNPTSYIGVSTTPEIPNLNVDYTATFGGFLNQPSTQNAVNIPNGNISIGTGNIVSGGSVTATSFSGSGSSLTGLVTSLTGDGLLIGNSSSNGAVTLTDKAQTANTVIGSSSTTLSALTMPSCSGGTSALKWTTGTGFGCNTISGAISSVSNSDGTLTISPTTGAVVASLALGHANTWAAVQTFTNSDLLLLGSSTGATTFTSANASSTAYTITVPAITDILATLTATQEFSNKRNDSRNTTTNAPGATPTMNTDSNDLYIFTGLATAITSMTTNLSGTPKVGDRLEIWFTDNGTGRGITWGASFSSSTTLLPSTTVAGITLTVVLKWNGSTWNCKAVT